MEKMSNIIKLVGSFKEQPIKVTPSTPYSRWKHILYPFKVGVEDVWNRPPWSWKIDYTGALYICVQTLGVMYD